MIHVLLEFALCVLIGGAAAGVLSLMVLVGFTVECLRGGADAGAKIARANRLRLPSRKGA